MTTTDHATTPFDLRADTEHARVHRAAADLRDRLEHVDKSLQVGNLDGAGAEALRVSSAAEELAMRCTRLAAMIETREFLSSGSSSGSDADGKAPTANGSAEPR